MSRRDLAARGAVLTVSALAHVLVYGALSLVPASPPPPRTGLIVTELVASEPPTPPAPTREKVTPPRPIVRPKPPAKPVEPATPPTPIVSAMPTRLDPPVEDEAPAAPKDTTPRSAESAETRREVIAAEPATVLPAPASSTAVLSPDSATPSPALPKVTPAQNGSAAVVAALPPGSPVVTSSVTRTAIPRGGYQVTPSYPVTVRRLGIEGTALLRVFVDATGHVADIVVKRSAGHPDLDRAAADAVRRWRFDPARRGADAIAMWVELPVEFHLR